MHYPEEWSQLPKKERRRKMKELQKQQVVKTGRAKKLRIWVLLIVLLAAGGVGLYYTTDSRDVLPPTDIAGHVEKNPPSHVMDEPMPLTVQKHMLEHADGEGPPGVVINYNCDDFACEPDLKEQLAAIAQEHPEFVYIAPFPGMSKKIAITRYRKIETFDSFDRDGLIAFIEGK